MGAKWGAQKCPRRLFCQQYEMNFRQLRKGRFSPNLSTTRESRLKGRFWTEIYENFPFRGHLPPKLQSLSGQTSTPLRAGMHCREILFTPRCSTRAREFPRSGQCFCTTYSCGATGNQIAQFPDFDLFFSIQNP